MPSVSARTASKKKAPFLKRHHGMLAVIIVLGWLVPPLAVLVRFGIGFDFFLNIIFTCMGYIPGHVHNFFIQNIRNNYGKGRTPKWALRSGLVEDDTAYVKSTRQWGARYDERNPNNPYEDETRPYEDEFGNPLPAGEGSSATERFVQKHGIRPAQPAGGYGEDGNNTASQEEDLLAGLPDEERARRRKERRNKKTEYGAGLDEQDALERERELNGGTTRHNDSLIGDLEDNDHALYGSSTRRQNSGFSDRSSGADARGGGMFVKKSGRTKKSERYGLAADHKDLGSNSSWGRSSSSKRNGNTSTSRYSNDNYDIVDDTATSNRRRTNGDEEDFLNHQF